jgi:HipA-like protein
MNRKAIVKVNGIIAGILEEENREKYKFLYDNEYFNNRYNRAVSLTLPKTEIKFESDKLFPFFASLLAEGSNLSLQSRRLKIDKQDIFGMLLKTASSNTIGNVTIHEVTEKEVIK